MCPPRCKGEDLLATSRRNSARCVSSDLRLSRQKFSFAGQEESCNFNVHVIVVSFVCCGCGFAPGSVRSCFGLSFFERSITIENTILYYIYDIYVRIYINHKS